MVLEIEIKALSALHLSSGRADVTVDSDVMHDGMGLPVFPGRRLKGLLYESALEITEMAGMEGYVPVLGQLFHHSSRSGCQLIIPDLTVARGTEYSQLKTDWQRLQSKYSRILNPTSVLEEYTSIRYQTRMENGIVARGSLRNLRVVNAGISFYGEIQLLGGGEAEMELLVLAVRNLRHAGMKRNRGFGTIECTLRLPDGSTGQALIKKVMGRPE